jgi:hypothetical protein
MKKEVEITLALTLRQWLVFAIALGRSAMAKGSNVRLALIG